MPPLPGEVILCTLYALHGFLVRSQADADDPCSFADVHYYFSHPAAKPPHHRFDRRSYVYLYHDALNHRGRMEIANYAGTPEQDAFMGCKKWFV